MLVTVFFFFCLLYILFAIFVVFWRRTWHLNSPAALGSSRSYRRLPISNRTASSARFRSLVLFGRFLVARICSWAIARPFLTGILLPAYEDIRRISPIQCNDNRQTNRLPRSLCTVLVTFSTCRRPDGKRRSL